MDCQKREVILSLEASFTAEFDEDNAVMLVSAINQSCCVSEATVGSAAISHLAQTFPGYLGRIGACESVVGLINKFGIMFTVVMDHCLDAITRLAASETNRDKFADIGACETMVLALTCCVDNGCLLSGKALQALSKVATGKGCQAKLGQLGACEAVMNILLTKPDPLHVCMAQCGLLAIWTLSIDVENKARLGRLGACEFSVSILEKYGTLHQSIAVNASGAIWSLSNHEGNRNILGRMPTTCNALIAALNKFGSPQCDHAVTKQACGALYSLLCVTADKAKMSKAAVMVLARFGIGDARIAQRWLSAISYLATTPANQAGWFPADDAVLVMMKQFGKSDVEVAKNALCAMACLAASEANRLRLGDKGGCKLVLSVLTKFGLTSPLIATRASSAIWNLALSSRNRNRLARYGICEALVGVLSRFGSTHEDLIHSAFGAIRMLAINVGANQKFGELGLRGILITVLDQLMSGGAPCSPPPAWRVQSLSSCLGAMSNLAGDNTNCVAFAQIGACELTVRILEQHGRTNLVLAERGCEAIRRLAIDAQGKQILVRLGARTAITKALDNPRKQGALNACT